MEAFVFNATNTRDLTPYLMDEGLESLRVLPASFYAGTTAEERAVVGMKHGLYGLPTIELVQWLLLQIQERSAIEIGAGHGQLAKALGIVATDNKMQSAPEIQDYYKALGQTPVPYGDHVEHLDAEQAIKKYSPQVVIGSWVTHKYNPDKPELEGNMFGVDETAILDSCQTYIFIGNTHVHRNKPIWARPHQRIEPDWLYSRAVNGSKDFIAVFNKC